MRHYCYDTCRLIIELVIRGKLLEFMAMGTEIQFSTFLHKSTNSMPLTWIICLCLFVQDIALKYAFHRDYHIQ